MRPRTILPTSPEVSFSSPPAPGTIFRVPLLEITTPEGVTYHYQAPLVVYAKLFDRNGNEIPPQSNLIIGKQSTDEELPRYLRKISYSPYYDLSEAQQRDERFQGSLRHELGRGVTEIKNPEGHLFIVEIESPVEVNLPDPRTRFEMTVRESTL